VEFLPLGDKYKRVATFLKKNFEKKGPKSPYHGKKC
jgi:hypothetical protein